MRILTAVAIAFLAAPAVAQDGCPFPTGGSYLGYTRACLVPMIQYRDDPLSFEVTTSSADLVHFAATDTGTADAYFVAGRDRKTRKVEVRMYITTRSPNWLFAQSVQFGDPLRRRELKRLATDTDCARRSGCVLTERFAFALEADD